jgi:hypothetical protein
MAQHPVSAGDLGRRAGQRDESVHEVGVALPPHPAVHAAHRRPHHEPQVRHAEVVDEEPALRVHHVVIVVVREPGVQPLARPARLAVTDAVGQDDVIDGRVERFAGAVQRAGEDRTEELAARAGGAVENEHGVAHHAARVTARMAEGAVVDRERGQALPAGEGEAVDDVVACEARQRAGLTPRGSGENRERGERGDSESASGHGGERLSSSRQSWCRRRGAVHPVDHRLLRS